MSITAKATADNSELTIAIDGRFDFSTHQEFRKAYESCDPAPASFIVDMQATTYLDSSALGMLLLLRDYAGGDHANVRIVNCNDDVKKILTISNFEQLFEIH
jgi:HptB-dependent secretion and biofilm anti anti-sigma factor